MRSLPAFLLSILKTAARAQGARGRMAIIIRRPYAALNEELRRAFEGAADVQVIVDRRTGERRTSERPVAVERRRTDRRRPKEELVEVVISD